ncbi:hypothetical protein L288_12455 [Sphingobium quisquiliarum P25]|uniref:Type I secretion system permease/ATPase n=2 Tax=Sphingobium quisquiliarum TaxID=538379 RepID=T0I1B5_9SPHN|nr:hypothetical protein L288_12455 [Sphingobium quisquiliarum P25]EZP71971.1 Type I secretion system ATPase [Sphingomonas paucimobilis]
MFTRKQMTGRIPGAQSPFAALVRPYSSIVLRVVIFSGIINCLTLVTSLYMMQVYDRVLTSQSKDTLLFLTIAVIFAIGLSAVLEGVRQKVANRIGTWIAQKLGPVLLERSLEQRLTMPGIRLEALREMNSIKNFVSTPSVFNIVDMLWVPIYLFAVFLLSPWFGLVALVGAGLLFSLAYINERASRQDIRDTQAQSNANMQFAESLSRNSEVIDAMGMGRQVVERWSAAQIAETEAVDATQRHSSTILAVSKFTRYTIQIVLMATGALLILDLQLTGGAMIAGSTIVARLLAPIEASIGYWKQFVLARHSYAKLEQFCLLPRPRTSEMALPEPTGLIEVNNLTFVPPGLQAPIVRNVSFTVQPGELVAIVGPSASGKTTLSRLLVGVLKPSAGNVRLDTADVFEWKRSDFGRHVGYLPQDIELLPGTIRDNIARFLPDAADSDVIAAAKLADCHEMILRQRNGYELSLSEGGVQLSGGQRQRIGLARAMFGSPRLVVLDEPNASLDQVGDAALMRTLRQLQANKVTTIVVSHRRNLLQIADRILIMQEGRVVTYGPGPAVLAQLEGNAQPREQRHVVAASRTNAGGEAGLVTAAE